MDERHFCLDVQASRVCGVRFGGQFQAVAKASQQPDCTPGHLWTSVDMRGHVWTCVDICEQCSAQPSAKAATPRAKAAGV